jgi:putative transposase
MLDGSEQSGSVGAGGVVAIADHSSGVGDEGAFNLHFTPTSASWLNLVERRFGLISEQAIRRGSFGSVAQLERVITRFVEHWNQNARPLVWTKTAQQIRRSIRNAKLISET